MNPAEQFVQQVEAFAHWAAHGTDQGSAAARSALKHIVRLYASALRLTIPANSGDNPELPDVDKDERKKVYAHAARLPLDHYSEIFDPLPVPANEPVTGSLSDDIINIYCDLVSPLRAYHQGHHDYALWQWTFSLQIHWGEHATSAIRALHCWLAQNAPTLLSAEP